MLRTIPSRDAAGRGPNVRLDLIELGLDGFDHCGLSWSTAWAYRGTALAANAYTAAGLTPIATGALLNGALASGSLIGSAVSPFVIRETILDQKKRAAQCGCSK